jgi:hypothetical protein
MQTLLSITIVQALGIMVFAGLAIMVAGFILQTKTLKKKAKEKVQADAIILTITKTGLYVDNQPQVKLQMQVQPESGRNFIAEIKQAMSVAEAEKVVVGANLKVLYDPADLKGIELAAGL